MWKLSKKRVSDFVNGALAFNSTLTLTVTLSLSLSLIKDASHHRPLQHHPLSLSRFTQEKEHLQIWSSELNNNGNDQRQCVVLNPHLWILKLLTIGRAKSIQWRLLGTWVVFWRTKRAPPIRGRRTIRPPEKDPSSIVFLLRDGN